ncbi:hypothetical protein INT47_010960 [Mucor saturninus]|uniref:BTB domain-containing protein n=1 Tax=Mucor saturninus TaxID=64648 RepID=A0A8H7RE75_9FUNG|nr:hypothetical protein INT47_010960 [Mucor saturninus]
MSEETRLYNEQVARINGRIVRLNVGGTRFYTHYGTLRVSPYFRTDLFKAETNEEIFIDRSGQLFTHILQYLRDGRINHTDRLEALRVEAIFYQLDDLVNKLDNMIKNPLSDSNKEYKLIDFTDLKDLSKLSSNGGSITKTICDTYDLITVVSYPYIAWNCSLHGSIAHCPPACGGSINSVWSSTPCEKLLVRKK